MKVRTGFQCAHCGSGDPRWVQLMFRWPGYGEDPPPLEGIRAVGSIVVCDSCRTGPTTNELRPLAVIQRQNDGHILARVLVERLPSPEMFFSPDVTLERI